MITDIIIWVIYFISLYFLIFWLSIFLVEPNRETHKKAKIFPKVSIVIPAHNEEENIVNTAKSVLALDYPKEKLELIIVNDGSTDNTRKYIEEYIKINKITNLRLFNKKAGGSGAAAPKNYGAKRATGEFVAFLDGDSMVSPSALKDMVPYFTNKEVAVVTPMMKVHEPKNLLQSIQKYEYILSLFIKKLMSNVNCIYVAPGPFSIYRKTVFHEIGGFDESVLTEDMEIIYRLQKINKYKVKQCLKGGSSYTVAPKNLKELWNQRNRWYKGSLLNMIHYRKLLLNKRYGDFGLIQMPRNIYGFVAAVTTLTLFAYLIINPIIQKLKQLAIINFDIAPYLKTHQLFQSIDLLSIPTSKIFVSIVLLSISLLFLICSHKFAEERFTTKSLLPLALLFFIYPVLISGIYLFVGVETMFKKKQKW